jgi:hypothetical protein
LAAAERERNFETMDRFYRGRRSRLDGRYDRTYDSAVDYGRVKRAKLISERDRAVCGQQNRIECLEKQIVVKCEQKGITQGEINLDLVDDARIAVVRQKEATNPIAPLQAAAASNANRRAMGQARRGRPKDGGRVSDSYLREMVADTELPADTESAEPPAEAA